MRPTPAMPCWSRRNVCSRVPLAGAVASWSRWPRPRRCRGRRAAAGSGFPATTHTPACVLPASVSSSAVPSSKLQRAMPLRGQADCVRGVGDQVVACMRCTTKVRSLVPVVASVVASAAVAVVAVAVAASGTVEAKEQELAPPVDPGEGRPTASVGAGTAVLRAVKVIGVNPLRVAPANPPSATGRDRRSTWAWTSGSSGIPPRYGPRPFCGAEIQVNAWISLGAGFGQNSVSA